MIFWSLIALCVIIGLAIAFLFAEEGRGFFERATGAFFGFLLGAGVSALIAGCIYLPLAYAADDYSHWQPEKDQSQALHAINMGTKTEGSFFLGSGYVDGENVYSYFFVNENGNLQSGQIDADSAEIVQSDTETPHIVTHYYKMPWWYGPGDLTNSYTIYVPVGSVTANMNINLP